MFFLKAADGTLVPRQRESWNNKSKFQTVDLFKICDWKCVQIDLEQWFKLLKEKGELKN